MGGLLHNARKFFRGLAAPVAPPRSQGFSVACPEGHRLSDQRTAGYQALRCPTCGEGLFVLPRSPLPAPAAPAEGTSPRSGPRSPRPVEPDEGPVSLRDPAPPVEDNDGADGEVQWMDEAEGAPAEAVTASPEDLAAAEIALAAAAAPAPTPAPTPPRPSHRPGARPRPMAPRGPEDEGAPVTPPAPRVSLAERVRRNRNPLIFAGVALLVAATVGVRLWRARRAELPLVAERGRTEGLQALDEGRFDKAHQILGAAKRAVLALGGAYQGAAAIIQGADEAAIIAGLCPDPLEDLLDEAARADPKEWPRRFATYYQGRSIIIDSVVRSVPDSRGEGAYDLEYRVLRAGEGDQARSVGRIDLTGFRLFDLIKPAKDAPVRFGARLASFRFDPDTGPDGTWVVGLESDSGVIMTHQKALDALGWPADDPDPAAEARP